MNYYLLFKSLHLISVISWMAGLLYLPRIFVYHAENNDEIKIKEVFKVNGKKIIFLHHDASNDFVMDIWFAFDTQHRFSAIRTKVDGIKNSVCVIANFISFLFRKYFKSV